MAKHCVNDSMHVSGLGSRRWARVSGFPKGLQASRPSRRRNTEICVCNAYGAISLVKIESRSKDDGDGAEPATRSHHTVESLVEQVDAVSDVTLTGLSSVVGLVVREANNNNTSCLLPGAGLPFLVLPIPPGGSAACASFLRACRSLGVFVRPSILLRRRASCVSRHCRYEARLLEGSSGRTTSKRTQ